MTAGLPRDPAQWLALLLAALALLAAPRLLRPSSRPSRFAALTALAAAALSAAYVAVYLRGGPRIIDATSYFLEARALSEGHLAWPIEAPETSVLGRFLVRSEWPDGARAAVIFPPGYPAILALGFLAGAPLAVGPLLAAALVLVTFDLARLVAPRDLAPDAPSIPQLAALFSVVCAALRYHTADTMSHGLAALCFAGSLALAFRARDALAASRSGRAHALAALAGLASGWLFATRPVSAFALAPILAFTLFSSGSSRSRGLLLAPALLAGALPGALLFFAHQHAATGAWGLSSQRLYYALSDGPTDCFRYGFGAGIGCVGEHGDFVRSRLASGYGALAAIGTTLRRLKLHLVDCGNLEPLALLVPAGAILARRAPRARLLGLAVIAQIAAYIPFYFDGNYPAGGARLYADVLPLEHVLAALAVAHLAARGRSPSRVTAASLALALALAGFALRAGFDHAQLRDREGGRVMFEPAELARAGVTSGLIFVDTDHGFSLAHDPAARATPAGGLEALRFHGDALDHLAWEARGRPPAFRYRFDFPADGARAAVAITPLAFPLHGKSPPIEAESLWPPVAQRGGFALREHAGGTCASAGRWLAIHRDSPDLPASITVEIPPRFAAGRRLAPRVAVAPSTRGEVELTIEGAVAARWRIDGSPGPASPVCIDLPGARVPAEARRVRISLRLDGGAQSALAALDYLEATGSEND